MLWIFSWDDEIDEGSDSDIAQDDSRANAYCQASLQQARLALGLQEAEKGLPQH